MIRALSIFLIILGAVLTGTAGYMDIKSKDEIHISNMPNIKISKKHLFSDGTYVTVLAVALLLLSKD